MKENPEILLVGTGAIGSFYCGKLHQAGASISAVCRSDYDAVKKHGIEVKSVLGDFHYTPEQIVKTASEYRGRPDFIVVATKVLPEISVPDMIRDRVFPETAVVLLQNGINIEEPVAEAFPDNELISGLAFICVTRTEPGHIQHEDYGRLVIGRYPSGISDKVALFADMLNRSGVTCTIEEDIIAARWKKLIWNAPFNPISVLSGGATTVEMIGSEPTLLLARRVMEEVALLARSTGHPIPEEVVQKNLDDTAVMTPYRTSMLLDYEGKRSMEVEAILGNAVRLAGKHGVPVPHIESLYGILSLLNRKNIKS